MKRRLNLKTCLSVCLGGCLFAAPALSAGTFNSDFNSGVPPAGMNLYGTTANYDHSTGGVNNSGVLKITDSTGSQQGGAIIDDFDNGVPVGGFDVTFQLFIGGGNGADGFAFFFGDFADAAHSEEGPGTINGLTIAWDVYNNGGTVAEAPAIDVKWNNTVMAHRRVAAANTTTGAQPIGSATTIRTQPTTGGAPVYWPVKIHVDTDGTLDLVYNNVVIVTNMPIFRPLTEAPVNGPAHRFGFSARTGGSTDNHWIDDLKITTVPMDASSGQPFLRSIAPVTVGSLSSPLVGVVIELQDATYSVATNTIQLSYNGAAATPAVTKADGITRIVYRGPTGNGLPPNQGTVRLQYSTSSSPAATVDYSYVFGVEPLATAPSGVAIASVDKTKPGFNVRVNQINTYRAPGDRNLIVNAERQVNDGYLDPATGQPYPNTAELSTAVDGWFVNDGVINYNYNAPGEVGNFRESGTPSRVDQPFPGIPGGSDRPTEEFVVEMTAFLELKAGGYRFGVNSDDGFRLSVGPGFDAAGTTIVGSFNGGRGSADSPFDVVIPQDGFYPFRLTYWQGGGDANAEFFVFDPATLERVLVNDPEDMRAPRAYRESPVSRPSITRALPVQNWLYAFPDDDVIIDITDGGIPLTDSSVVLKINNVEQTVTKTKAGKVTTIKRAGSVDNLLPSGLTTVALIYGYQENGSPVLRTNSYQFTVAPYYNAIPVANKVPAGQINMAETGFSARYHQIDRSGDANQGNGGRIAGGGDGNRMPWPEIQINNGNINPVTGNPYPNTAEAGPNGNHTVAFDLLNFRSDSDAAAGVGMFTGAAPALPLPGSGHVDEVMPGIPGTGTSNAGRDNYVMEATTYLDLKKGVYVFGMNSDDGFVVSSAPNPKDTLGSLLGFFNGGRGNSGNLVAPVGQNPPAITPGTSSGSTPFSVVVPEDGIYPFRVLYWQGGGGVNAEFYTLNKQNGTVLLVNDVAEPAAVPAYRGYTGPEKPWTKLSVSPTPWDNRSQQAGPGPLTMVGRTKNNVASTDIYNLADNVRPWADVAIGGVIANGAADAANIRLLLDGTEVPATKTPQGADLKVSYQPNPPLASGSTHKASLVYGGATNSWSFTVQTYATVNAADAQPLSAADASAAGFSVKIAQALAPNPALGNTAARAETQLAGTPANVAIPSSEPDGRYIVPGIINWNSNINNAGAAGVQLGNFQDNTYGPGWPFPDYADEAIPGVPGTGTSGAGRWENLTAEIFAYLRLPAAGYYRFGANADDGVVVKIGTPGVTNGTVLFTQDRGGGAQDIPFSFVAPQAGLYPVRLLWYQGTGGGAVEFFSYDQDGNKIAVNDPNNPNAIKAYYKLQGGTGTPEITYTVAGGTLTITWTNGGTLESASAVTGPWTSTGDSDGSYTENLAGATGSKFFRVRQ